MKDQIMYSHTLKRLQSSAVLAGILGNALFQKPHTNIRHASKIKEPPKPSKHDQFFSARYADKNTMTKDQLINSMTNWQRNQWGKAGYPEKIENIRQFSELPHHKKSKAITTAAA